MWPHPQYSHIVDIVNMVNTVYNLSHLMIYFGEVIDRIYDVIIFILKYLYFKKA